jgi:MFS family permease
LTALVRWKHVLPVSKLPREDIGPAIGAGLRYVSMSPNLIKVFVRSFVFGLAAVAVLALLPVLARDMNGGPLTYGLMLGAFGFGAVGGAYFNTLLRERMTSETIVRCALGGFALSESVVAATDSLVLMGASLILAGACWVVALSLFNTIVQLSTPRWVVGRALAFYQMATFGGMAAGSWLWGGLAENLDVATSLWFAALLAALGLLMGFALPMPVLASLDLDPLDGFKEPELHLDIRPRSGPIAVQVVYEIRDQDLGEFLELMVERRRIRIRDGAQAWALMRDLEMPNRWTETYHTPTWVDYVRHNTRRTRADRENLIRLRGLHQGEGLPEVRRMIERQVIPLAGDVFHQVQI